MSHRWARLLLPNLAVCLSSVTVFYCLVLFNAPQQLFRDSDAGWHIRTGERILSTLALPRSDPYSFSRAGQPWLAWEWGSDVAMGAANRLAGLTGVVWLFVLAIAAVTWLWVRLNWAVGGNFFLAGLFAAPMLSTVNLHWLARPHVFSWLLLVGFLSYFETAQPRFRVRDGAVIALGSIFWVNIHASFLALPVMALVYAVGHLARPLIWNLDSDSERKRALWFALAAIIALAASVVNPYGLRVHAHVIRYLADGELLDRVAEFQSFNFHANGSFQILLMTAIAAVGGVLALIQKKIAHFLLAALFLGGALRSARGLPIAALLLLPLANGAITEALRQARGVRPQLRRALQSFLQYSDRLRLLDARLSGLAWTPLLALLVLGWLRLPLIAAQTGFPPDQFPVIAAGELASLPPNARLLAPDKYGGYLIYRFDGRLKVFFDGRSDLYGSVFMKDYLRLVEVRPGWREQLEQRGFTHALLPLDYSLVPALEGIGWRELYRDEVAVVLQRELGRQ